MVKLWSLMTLVFSLNTVACTLTMQAQHYPPRFIKQSLEDGTISWTGFNAELFTSLVQRSGCNAKIVEVPWGRALQLLADGRIDAMSNMSANAQRAQYAHFIGPHQQERILVLGHTGSDADVTNFSSLINSGQPISVMQGIYYGKAFAAAINQHEKLAKNLNFVSSSKQKLDLFIAKRVQFTFEDSVTLQQLYDDGTLDPAKHIAIFTLHENPVYFAVSKQSVSNETLTLLQHAWQEIVADGSLKQLQEKYFPQSYSLN